MRSAHRYNRTMSEMLTPAERRDLKGRAHALHPTVMIGNDGLTPAVLKAIDEALRAHELIKIRASAERDERDALLAEIAAQTGAAPVQHIGKMLVVWRKRPLEESESDAPKPKRSARPRATVKASAKKPPRAARPARDATSPRQSDPRTPGALAPARPGRAPRMMPKRGRPTRSGRR
jgi:RNA-binding protein